jgi:hydroxyethylthiazole kinase-like uncharacterized protein yjeF
MVITDPGEKELTNFPAKLSSYSAVGIGPGIGTSPATQSFITALIEGTTRPLVLDADALNCIALKKYLLRELPPLSILTPHPKEFDRLFCAHQSDFARLQTAKEKSAALQLIILLKGHHTLIVTPGITYINMTGNSGMAKGGSGDVLTGMLTALLAQGYDPVDAAVLGVYLHGKAGDLAMEALSVESMLPSELVDFLPAAFRELSRTP